MESKEILKEFAGKLAGLSAAAKVVAIAGAMSTMHGALFATGGSAVERIPFDQKQSNALSDHKREEVAAGKEKTAEMLVSEKVVKTLSARKEETRKEEETTKGKSKTSDQLKPVVTSRIQIKPSIQKKESASKPKIQGKTNIAPSIQKKVDIYEQKYDKRYYQLPGTAVKTPRTYMAFV